MEFLTVPTHHRRAILGSSLTATSHHPKSHRPPKVARFAIKCAMQKVLVDSLQQFAIKLVLHLLDERASVPNFAMS